MERKSKVLISIFALAVLFVIGVTFYKFEFKKDYLILGQAACDPEIDSCFYMPCDDTDPTCDPTAPEYYKKIEKKAFNIELCDPSVDGCNPMVCAEDEKDCSIIACSGDNKDEWEECSGPTQE
jgi:hypothetical protein